MANVASTPEANEAQPPPVVPSAVVSAEAQPTSQPTTAGVSSELQPASGAPNVVGSPEAQSPIQPPNAVVSAEAQTPIQPPNVVVSASPQLTQQERAKAEALADRALQGDLEALKTFEAEVPNARHYLIEVFGNLARDTRRQIIESYLSPEDAVRKRGINLAADELRATLGNDTGDPLERLLIERIACNWIEVHLVEQLTNQLRADGQASLDQVEYYQKFLDRTQRRFLNACKTLAQVRKLMGVDTKSRTPTAGKATRPRHPANYAGVEQLVLEVEAKGK